MGVIKLELDESIRGDFAVVQVPWYLFYEVDARLRMPGVVVMMTTEYGCKVTAGNPGRLYQLATMLHEVFHQISRSSKVDLD
jgi:hypothetical protein